MKNLSPKATRRVREIDRRREEIIRELVQLAHERRQVIDAESDFPTIHEGRDITKEPISTGSYRALLDDIEVTGGVPL